MCLVVVVWFGQCPRCKYLLKCQIQSNASASKENAIEIVDFIMSRVKRIVGSLFLSLLGVQCSLISPFCVRFKWQNWNLTPASVFSSKSTLISNGMVIIQNLFSLCEGPNQERGSERERTNDRKIKSFPQLHTLTHNYRKKLMTLNLRPICQVCVCWYFCC